MKYRCMNGQDRCFATYPGKDCPTCERVYTKKEMDALIRRIGKKADEQTADFINSILAP